MFSNSRRNASPNSGFYESFSDVIFATMAIFILLMAVFMVVIRQGQVPPDLASVAPTITPTIAPIPTPTQSQHEQRASEIRKQLENQRDKQRRKMTAEMEKEQLIAEIEGLSERLEASQSMTAELNQAKAQAYSSTATVTVKERDIEIVVIIDTSGSMSDELRELRGVLKRLAQLIPHLTKSMRLSVIDHSRRSSGNVRVLPLTPVFRADQDGGKSVARIEKHLDAMQTVSGDTYILEATEKAIAMLPNIRDNHHQVIMIIGDVGPVEKPNGNVRTDAQSRIQYMSNLLTKWSLSHQGRKVILHYSGQDMSLTSSNRNKYAISQKMFKDIAERIGDNAIYSENPTTMFIDLLVSTID